MNAGLGLILPGLIVRNFILPRPPSRAAQILRRAAAACLAASLTICLTPDLAAAFARAPAGGKGPARLNLPLSTQAAAIFLVAVLIAVLLTFGILRRMVGPRRRDVQSEPAAESPGVENPAAFVTASMQGVIRKLREQEKELERLHQAERERANETERLSEAVTRNMPAGLLLINATGIISSANPAAEAALGQRGLQYRHYREVLGADSVLAEMAEVCLREGRKYQRDEVRHTTPAGDTRHLGVTISPITRAERPRSAPRGQASGPLERPAGALCLMSDLSDVVALQRQMRWKENLAALGEMSAGIAHEFKNALATISGYAQMIRSEAQNAELAESAERILDQTRSLTHVVTEFLRFARPLEANYDPVGLRALVEAVVAETREAMPGGSIQAEGQFSEVDGDEGLLRQALLNLARNAAEAVAEVPKGQVIISGAIEEKAGRQWQRIAVSDNGPGIPPGELDKLFVPFYTTKAQGTGLGLPLVQKIAVHHSGSVEATGRAGGGAEFILWLPLRQGAPTQVIASAEISI